MRLLFCVVVALGLPASACGVESSTATGGHLHDSGLVIRVEGEGWGMVRRDEIEAILYVVGDQMFMNLPATLAAPIVVMHSETVPITLYDRGPSGEYLVRLGADGSQLPMLVYQFAHEFCHIMSNFDARVTNKATKSNQWFDEVLCEAASRYALRKVATAWQAPSSGHAGDVAGLIRFYKALEADADRHHTGDISLPGWIDENAAALRKNPYQRGQNDLLAERLLPLFELHRSLDALCFIDLDRADDSDTLPEYVRHWYLNAPADQRALIAQIMALLGLRQSPADDFPGAQTKIGGMFSLPEPSGSIAGRHSESIAGPR